MPPVVLQKALRKFCRMASSYKLLASVLPATANTCRRLPETLVAMLIELDKDPNARVHLGLLDREQACRALSAYACGDTVHCPSDFVLRQSQVLRTASISSPAAPCMIIWELLGQGVD